MLEHVDNYEEAKVFLKKDSGGYIDKRVEHILKLRAGIISGLAIAGIAGLNAIDPIDSPILEPLLFFSPFGFYSIIPLIRHKKILKSFKEERGDKYFTEEEIIKEANARIDSYNEIEQRGKSI